MSQKTAPKQAIAAAEVANQLLAELNAPPAPPTDVVVEPVPVLEQQPAAVVEAQPTSLETAPPLGDVDRLNAEVQRLTAEVAAANHRYAVLEGKYRADVAEMRERAMDAEDTVVRLTDKMAQRPAAPALAPAPDTSPQDLDPDGHVGPDALEVIRKLAKAEAAAATQAAIEPIHRRDAEVEAQRFWADWKDAVPDSKALEAHPRFQEYMHDLHPDTGLPRGEMVRELVVARRIPQLTNIYNAFRQWASIAAPVKTVATSPIKPLEQRLAPVGAGVPAPVSTVATPSKQTFTGEEARAFYRDMNIAFTRHSTNAKRLTAAEIESWKQRERELITASQEGRVRG